MWQEINRNNIKKDKRQKIEVCFIDNVFVNNHLCSISSMAVVIILGRNSNRYSEWKNKDGIKLKDLID